MVSSEREKLTKVFVVGIWMVLLIFVEVKIKTEVSEQ